MTTRSAPSCLEAGGTRWRAQQEEPTRVKRTVPPRSDEPHDLGRSPLGARRLCFRASGAPLWRSGQAVGETTHQIAERAIRNSVGQPWREVLIPRLFAMMLSPAKPRWTRTGRLRPRPLVSPLGRGHLFSAGARSSRRATQSGLPRAMRSPTHGGTQQFVVNL